MQFDQGFRQGAQHFATDTAIVDPSGLASVWRVDPPQDQLIGCGNACLCEHSLRGVIFAQIEPCRDLALRGTAAHQLCPPAPSQHETQRIQQDRLARAGFTGQYVQPRLNIQFKPVNDQDISDI